MRAAQYLPGLVLALFVFAAGQAGAETQGEEHPMIEWLGLEEALERHKEQPRKLLIDIYTDWCSWCKVMDQKVFSDPLIAEYVSGNFYAVKLDGERKDALRFRDKEYVFQDSVGRPAHGLASELLEGHVTYPAYVMLDEALEVVQRVRGFKKAPHFYGILAYVAGGDYRNTKFEAFMKSHKSPYPFYSYEDSRPRLISH